MKCAIIGAGIAGLACAELLAEAGIEVQLFDKGRGPGGRLSTRRMETPVGEISFDHGAQYLTAKTPDFRAQLERWAKRGIVAPWPAGAPLGYVGVPGMNAIIKDMSKEMDVSYGQPVQGLSRRASSWHLCFGDGARGPFDVVMVALPAEQAAPLLSLHDFEAAKSALRNKSHPCWTAMLGFSEPLRGPDFYQDRGNIAWAARNNSKPGRSAPEAWVVQASAQWTEHHLDCPLAQVAEQLSAELARLIGQNLPEPIISSAHRWMYAFNEGTGSEAIWNSQLKLGVCGDWLHGPRAESAWLSGRALAKRLLASSPLANTHRVRLTARPGIRA